MKCSMTYCNSNAKYTIWLGSGRYHLCAACARESSHEDGSVGDYIDRAITRGVIKPDKVKEVKRTPESIEGIKYAHCLAYTDK